MGGAQAWVDDACTPIVNHGLPRPNFAQSGPPFSAAGGTPLCVRAAALRDSRTLDIYWFLPPLIEQTHCKPAEYVSHLVGHEGKGSLLAALKAR